MIIIIIIVAVIIIIIIIIITIIIIMIIIINSLYKLFLLPLLFHSNFLNYKNRFWMPEDEDKRMYYRYYMFVLKLRAHR